ncbi:MAG: hypothetical protein JWM47_2940 [Acidimicrobiales bacterium]|nr:hypothetical protein [Acidimicrobiales bacterium]
MAEPTDGATRGDATQGEGESKKERLNRELDQLLQELRVALPGVQVLLAFLLTVPFTERFAEIDLDAQRAYSGAVLLAALASILLIAPTVHHRLRFRDGIKEEMIRTANRLALIGAGCLGLAIGCAVYVVGDVAFPHTSLRLVGPATVVLTALVWFVLPLRYRAGQTDRNGPARR